MTPEEFVDRWDPVKDGPLNKWDEKEVMKTAFSLDVKRFLTSAGLPETPPPYLELHPDSFRPVTGMADLPEQYQTVWILGSTGSGDPICLVEKNENIVILPHGDHNNKVFVNSSLNQFAACLVAYVSMIDKAIAANGEDAYLDNDLPDAATLWLKEELMKIDAKCMQAGSFWSAEYDTLFE